MAKPLQNKQKKRLDIGAYLCYFRKFAGYSILIQSGLTTKAGAKRSMTYFAIMSKNKHNEKLEKWNDSEENWSIEDFTIYTSIDNAIKGIRKLQKRKDCEGKNLALLPLEG